MSTKKLYQPSNGTEGMIFYDNWCVSCVREKEFNENSADGKGCDTLAMTMVFDVGDKEYPKAWTFDDEGDPVCTEYHDEDLENPLITMKKKEENGQLRLF